MGLFISNIRHLNEIDINGQPINQDNQEEPADYTQDNQQEAPPQDQGNEPPQDDQGAPPPDDGNQPPPEEGEPVDYTDGADEPPPDGGGYDDGGGGAPPPPPPEEGQSEVDDFKKQEEELYNELTPEQLDIKHKELKNRFLSLYDMIVSLVDKIGDAAVSEENISVIEYVSTELASLKDMVADYVNDVYKTKSYVENSINYNRFIAVLNGISKILEEMNSKSN